jgi:hypothetical protein
MTVSTEDKRKQYAGSGSAGPFPITFPILAKEDVAVTRTSTTDVDTVMTLDAGSDGFSVDTALENITLTEALAPGEQLTIERDLTLTQTTDYVANDPFPSEVHERALDKLTMITQQVQDGIDRSVKVSSTTSISIIPELTGTPTDGELLSWSGTTGAIGNTTVADLDTSIDTIFTSLVNSDFLQYNGTVWENITVDEMKTELGIKKDNYAATAAPTVNDDSGDGYSVGSRWFDTTGDNMYHCLDATVGAANWDQGDLIADDLGSAAVADLIDADDFTGATSTNINSAEATKAYVDAVAASSGVTQGTTVATTSGTAFDFTTLPSDVKRITVALVGVSLSGSDQLLIQVGDSGGVETSGYDSQAGTFSSSATFTVSSTSGFVIRGNSASNLFTGQMIITNMGSNQWVASFSGFTGSTVTPAVGGGSKTLSDTLDRVRLTRTGSDTFDAGSVNIIYDR